MTTYQAAIDGGQGGATEIDAASIREALVQAIEWARNGDWPDEGCDVDVSVADDDNEEEVTIEIPSAGMRHDDDLSENGERIAHDEGEYSTEQIVVMDGQAYYMHPNGGARGAHDRQCGDGVWREYPCSPTRKISKDETRRLMLDWGYEPVTVEAKTRDLN